MKRKIKIRFKVNKRGKHIAHYWGRAERWLPISVDAAELKLATGEAERAVSEDEMRAVLRAANAEAEATRAANFERDAAAIAARKINLPIPLKG